MVAEGDTPAVFVHCYSFIRKLCLMPFEHHYFYHDPSELCCKPIRQFNYIINL